MIGVLKAVLFNSTHLTQGFTSRWFKKNKDNQANRITWLKETLYPF